MTTGKRYASGQTDKQTDIYTDTLIAILSQLTGSTIEIESLSRTYIFIYQMCSQMR